MGSEDIAMPEGKSEGSPAHAPSHWADRRVSDVRKVHSHIPEGPSMLLNEHLKGALTEGPLTAGELTTLAKELIGAMLPAVTPKSQGPE
jgi:hypothetical protein